MANTTPDGIYFPDSNTPMVLDTILATMASSIANGIGQRLATLETYSDLGGRGVVGKNIATNTVSGVAGTNLLLNSTLPINLVAGRNYRVTVKGNFYASAANQAFQMTLRRSVANPNPTMPAAYTAIDDMSVWSNAILTSSGGVYNIVTFFTPTVSETMYVWASVVRAVGSGTGTFNASASQPRILFVEDAGKA